MQNYINSDSEEEDINILITPNPLDIQKNTLWKIIYYKVRFNVQNVALYENLKEFIIYR